MGIFGSAIRAKADLAGVFEYDETDDPQNATAYFYLYKVQEGKAGPVIHAIHLRSDPWAITETDIAVRWDKDERGVGVFIFGVLWAAFDRAASTKHGGGYGRDFQPDIPWS